MTRRSRCCARRSRSVDASDFCGPHVTNQIIHEALHPYPDGLHIVTKIGALRDAHRGWPPSMHPVQLRQAVHDKAIHLVLDVVNLPIQTERGNNRPRAGSNAEPSGVLADLRREALIRHLGLSTVTAERLAEARSIAHLRQNMSAAGCVLSAQGLTELGAAAS